MKIINKLELMLANPMIYIIFIGIFMILTAIDEFTIFLPTGVIVLFLGCLLWGSFDE